MKPLAFITSFLEFIQPCCTAQNQLFKGDISLTEVVN
ncbi:MAG: hypothetical protein ACJASL_000569 [Paraglaciecola sp.]|jgi:hypothetical protein